MHKAAQPRPRPLPALPVVLLTHSLYTKGVSGQQKSATLHIIQGKGKLPIQHLQHSLPVLRPQVDQNLTVTFCPPHAARRELGLELGGVVDLTLGQIGRREHR